MKKPYQIVTRAAKESAAVVEQFCQSNGQILLPIVSLIENASQVVENVIHEIQIQALETIFTLSAEQIAGSRTPGKPSGEIRWHGRQAGKIKLADREVKVKRPRLRHKTEGEVRIPAYEKLRQDRGLQQHMLGALMRGVSTREYEEVLPKMAETVGVSRSSVSRQAIEASAEQLKTLREKRWDATEVLVIYIDGQRFGAHHILSAVGVDREGRKHILGIEAGATENAAAVKRLLTHLRDQGLATDRIYLFVIDGAKALRAAIEEVFGTSQHVQRCRNHKLRNVLDELPEEQQGQTLNLMRAAWKVTTPEEGEKRLEQLARFLERDYESAARSLREGMAEMFTLQRLKLPPSLYKCLATTNVIESPQGGVARRTGNVTRWRDQDMVERWVARGYAQDLGTLPGGQNSAAYAINSKGVVAGISDAGSRTRLGFRWSDGRMQALLPLDGGFNTIAYGINDHGHVAGVSDYLDPVTQGVKTRAVIWEDDRPVDIHAATADEDGVAYALNSLDDAVGRVSQNGENHAFLYSRNSITLLHVQGTALSINDRRDIVGVVDAPERGHSSGFLWRQGKVFDLNDLVVGAAKSRVEAAFRINAAGEILCLGRVLDGTRLVLLLPRP